MERGHAPSISQRAFFQPLSSTVLQAHRGTSRPTSTTPQAPSEDGNLDDGASQTHVEASSIATMRTRPQVLPPSAPLAPASVLSSDLHAPAQTFTRATGLRKSVNGQIPVSSSPKSDSGSPSASPQLPTTPRSGYRFPGEKAASVYGDHEFHPARDATSGKEKNYQHFKAGRLFALGGLLQTARDRPFVLVTLTCIIIPSALFFAFPARYLWVQVSGGPAIAIIFALLLLHTLSAFAHASLSDPGILPYNVDRNPPPNPNADPLALGPPNERWVAVPSPLAKMGAFEVPCKFCKSCNIWRPPRCYHCGICDVCVDTLDHHCVWLNNCIGRRNYVHFLTFVSSLSVLALFLAVASICQVAALSNLGEQLHDVQGYRVSVALFAIGILGFIYPAALGGYHVFLMARGETTREYLNNRKRPQAERYRPFSTNNWFRNIAAVVFKPIPPVNIDFHAGYIVGDQRFDKRD